MWWTDDDTVIVQGGGGGPGQPMTVTGSGEFEVIEPVTARWTDQVNAQDALRVALLNSEWGRSGTPDTDQAGDAWVFQNEGANNFGNEDLQVQSTDAVGNQRKRAFVAIDLTWAANFVGQSGTPFMFRFLVSHNLIGAAADMLYAVTRHAARPFTESTVTWDNQPSAGTAVTNGNISIPDGAASTQVITLTKVQLDPCLGQWLLITFNDDDIVLRPIFIVRSRDGASNRWSADVRLQR